MYYTAQELIDHAETRLNAAKALLEDFNGERQNGLSVTKLHGFVIVDDEADRWIAAEFDYNNAVAEVVDRALTYKYDRAEGMPHANELINGGEDVSAVAYNDLCAECGCIYSKIGTGTLGDLAEALAGLDLGQTEEILDALAESYEDMLGWCESQG